MWEGHALRRTGRPRGEQRVERGLRTQRRPALGVGDRRRGQVGCARAVDDAGRDTVRHSHRCGIAGDEDQADPRGLRHGAYAVGRCVGVDGHVLAAGRDDGVDGHEHLHGAVDDHADRGLGTDTLRDQFTCKDIHPCTEFGIGHRAVTEHQRGLAGARLYLRRHHVGDGRETDVECGTGRGGHDFTLAGGVEHGDVAHGDRGIGGHAVENAHELLTEHAGRRLVEQVGGVHQRQRPRRAAGTGVDHDRQIRVCGHHRRGDARERDPGDLDVGGLGRGPGIERQDHLRQRRKGFGANRIHGLDNGFERYVGVREGIEVGGADLFEQPTERHRRIDLRPQHQRVDEHADQRVEDILTAAGRGRGHGDIGGRAQPRQERGECGVQHHERCRPGLRGQGFDAGAETVGQVHVDRRAAMRCLRGPRPVRRQFQHIGYAGELFAPVVDLPADDRVRLLGSAEHLMLPDREVRELYCQRLEFGFATGDPGGVGSGQVHQQRQQ